MLELFKQLTDRLRTMWVGMARGTRLALIALTGAVAVGIVLVWGFTSAGEPTWREIAGYETDQAKRQKIHDLLKTKAYEMDEDTFDRKGIVRVKTDRAGAAGLELVAASIIDGNDLYKYLEEANLTATTDDRDKLWLVKTQQRLETMLRGFGPVETASVQIVPMSETERWGGAKDTASASVVCRMKTGMTFSTNHSKAIAAVLSRAVKGLKPERVSITDADTGTLYPVPSEDTQFWESYHLNEVQKQYAADLKAKLSEQLQLMFPNHFTLAVVYGMSATSTRETTDAVDPSTINPRVERLIDKSVNTVTGFETGGSAFEKGVTAPLPPNVGSQADVKKERNEPIVGRTAKDSYTPGATKVDFLNVIATINIDPAKLAAYGSTVEDQKTNIKNHLKTLAQFTPKPADSTTEVPQPDISLLFTPPLIPPPAIPVATTLDEAKDLLKQYGLTLFLALIIIPVCLLMLRRTLKAALERGAVKELEEAKSQIETEGPEFADWEAAEALVARAKQQIKEMVQRNPRGVANVLKRWMAIPK